MNRASRAVLWCFLFGNFVVGFGVLMVPGALNDISHNLNISVAQAGLLITAGSVLMCVSAPIFATVLARHDRRKLLSFVMLWYGIAHLVCLIMPDFDGILWVRVAAMITPAIFTPQAAACVGQLASLETRGRAITFVFLGWSVASVIGMPIAAWLSEVHGWRAVFGLHALLATFSALWVWRVLPRGLVPPVMSLSAWRQTLFNGPLMLTVAVTIASASGQFVLSAFLAPYFKIVHQTTAAELSLMFGWFGACGLLGNVLMSRNIDRWGPARGVHLCLCLMLLSMMLWQFGVNLWLAALIVTPWGLGLFASNSAQQARLIHMAPALSSGSVALNTSAIYLGQAIGSATGSWLIAHDGLQQLHWLAAAGLLLALGISHHAVRVAKQQKA